MLRSNRTQFTQLLNNLTYIEKINKFITYYYMYHVEKEDVLFRVCLLFIICVFIKLIHFLKEMSGMLNFECETNSHWVK